MIVNNRILFVNTYRLKRRDWAGLVPTSPRVRSENSQPSRWERARVWLGFRWARIKGPARRAWHSANRGISLTEGWKGRVKSKYCRKGIGSFEWLISLTQLSFLIQIWWKKSSCCYMYMHYNFDHQRATKLLTPRQLCCVCKICCDRVVLGWVKGKRVFTELEFRAKNRWNRWNGLPIYVWRYRICTMLFRRSVHVGPTSFQRR